MRNKGATLFAVPYHYFACRGRDERRTDTPGLSVLVYLKHAVLVLGQGRIQGYNIRVWDQHQGVGLGHERARKSVRVALPAHLFFAAKRRPGVGALLVKQSSAVRVEASAGGQACLFEVFVWFEDSSTYLLSLLGLPCARSER